ncbi:hypothetical protein [Promicromonospora soli]
MTATSLGLSIGVRHAQDYDWKAGEEGPALVTIHLDQPPAFARPRRAVVADAVLETPSRSLCLGDAEGEILVPAPGPRARVVISHHDAERNQPAEAWIDLYPTA